MSEKQENDVKFDELPCEMQKELSNGQGEDEDENEEGESNEQ